MRYGLTKNIDTHNPARVAVHEYAPCGATCGRRAAGATARGGAARPGLDSARGAALPRSVGGAHTGDVAPGDPAEQA